MPESTELIRLDELAERSGIPTVTLRRRLRSSEIEVYADARDHRHYAIRKADVDRD